MARLPFLKAPNIVRSSVLRMSEIDERRMANWRLRAVIAAGSNHTHIGRIICRILAIPSAAPCFDANSPAIISPEGIIGAMFCERAGEPYKFVVVGTVQSYADDLRRLCHDQLRLDGHDAAELFNEARKWIGSDMRQPGVVDALKVRQELLEKERKG